MPVAGRGNGLVAAAVAAMTEHFGIAPEVAGFQQHALRQRADAQAVAYVECATADGGRAFGVGIDTDVAAALTAVLGAAGGVRHA